MRFWLFAVLSVLTVGALAQDAAIVGARIEIGDGRSIPKGTVLIRGGRITEVGANVSVPAGVPVYDGTGSTVYPGFIDAFTTTGLKIPAAPEAATPPNNTVTAPATMWDQNRRGIRGRLSAADCLDLAGTLGDAHKAGITAALFSPGSGLVRGRTAFAYLTDEKQSAKSFGIGLSFRGAGGGGPGGGGGGGGYPGTLFGHTALLRQTLADAQAYAENPASKEDLDLKGMIPLFKNEAPAIFAADTDSDFHRTMLVATEFKLPYLISGGREAYRRADQFAKTKTPILVNIAIGSEPTEILQADGPPQAVLDERKAVWRERAENVLKLDQANAIFAFSSDASGFSSYLANIRKIIKLGLRKESALRAMTLTPARIFGVDKELGTLEKGKIANVVVMTGDFVDEQSTVKAVFVAGKKFEVTK
jgi:imidazolonepropionase-like amidohydrolase